MTILSFAAYDLKTGEYTGSRDATQRPNGEYMLEATGATSVAADIPAGHIARWTGDAWETVEDHRQHMDERGRKEGGTPYWLPGDTWRSEPRYTEERPAPQALWRSRKVGRGAGSAGEDQGRLAALDAKYLTPAPLRAWPSATSTPSSSGGRMRPRPSRSGSARGAVDLPSSVLYAFRKQYRIAMGLRFVEYRRRQWVLRYRDPWSGKQRIKSFRLKARRGSSNPYRPRCISAAGADAPGEAAHVLGFGDKGHGRGAP